MLARLWWKEFRFFGPVLVLLALAAGLLQWLLVSVNSEDARHGGLTVSALCWAVLYAFAVAAAAFAGERESRTLGFLDALPVPRGTLWLGKASFSLVSTFGLALWLAGMAALNTESRDPGERYSYDDIVRVFGTILFEAVAWSLLWSALSKNPLFAGVMGVLSVYASAVVMDRLAAPNHLLASNDLVAPDAVPARLLAALAALVASGFVMRLRAMSGPTIRHRIASGRTKPIAIRASSTGRSLAWQAFREGWTTWLLVGFIGVVVPIGSSALDLAFDRSVLMLPAILAGLVAGVSVFGTENASGSRRFLVHHGVRPGSVWWRKLLVWGAGMGLLLVLLVLSFWTTGDPFRDRDVGDPAPALERLAMLSVGLANAFVIGIVCGMAIRRWITATLVGVILLVAIVPIQVALAWQAMIPSWSLGLVPLIFLAISRAWAGDWLLEREGAGPWVRLRALVVVPFGLLGMSYIAYRAFGVPDVGPQFDRASLSAPAIPPEQDAALLYRRADAVIRPSPARNSGDDQDQWPNLTLTVDEAIERGVDLIKAPVVAWREQNRPAIDLARRASALPGGRFEDVERMTFASGIDPAVRVVPTLTSLLALDALERQSRGDLPGAWDDILAQFRMADQLATSTPTLTQMTIAAQVHHRAVGLAFEWLGDPRQAPETVRKASADLKAVPPLPSLAATIRVESSILEKTLGLPVEDLAGILIGGPPGRPASTWSQLYFARVVAPPWERQRARRLARRIAAEEIPIVGLEPWQRVTDVNQIERNDPAFVGFPLARMLLPSFAFPLDRLDREAVGRRALEQAIALEAWKFEHDGKFPETLEALVPGLLDRLPLDPYSGKPFGYVRSEGQLVRSPILSDLDPRGRVPYATKVGQPLLYSVGPDRRDEGGKTIFGENNQVAGDFIFAVP